MGQSVPTILLIRSLLTIESEGLGGKYQTARGLSVLTER